MCTLRIPAAFLLLTAFVVGCSDQLVPTGSSDSPAAAVAPSADPALHETGSSGLTAGVTRVPLITDGELDGNDHPAVVLLVMDVLGVPTFLCSATLLTPTVVLTAGHCTNFFPNGEFTGLRAFTESDVEAGIGVTNNFPFCGGPNCVEAASWEAHPLYETAPFFVHDVGVVILEAPVAGVSTFGELPGQDELDALATSRGLQDVTFTSVGYGVQQITANQFFVVSIQADLVRYVANPHLVQINTGFTGDFSLLLSNNTSTGGTCFGDSGGPNFLGDSHVVAGVTSFGLNNNCGGTGGVFRMDRADVLAFVNSFLP